MLPDKDVPPRYDYSHAGFDPFLSRSIDGGGGRQSLGQPMPGGHRIAYDRQEVTGTLGDTLRIGNIHLDGVAGRISVFDGDENETVRIGELGD